MTFNNLKVGDFLELKNGLRFIITRDFDNNDKSVYGKPICEDVGWEFVFYEHDKDINKIWQTKRNLETQNLGNG